MVSIPKQRYITPEEYLAQERKAAFKSEYVHGRLYAMAGASHRHNRITFNVAGALYAQLRGKPCEAFAMDLRVKVGAGDAYVYPDAVVVCGHPSFEDTQMDTLTNPTLIIEVLSDSTEAYDRGRKFANYQRIESLTDYLLISQDEPRIEHYIRQADNAWLLTTTTGLDADVGLLSIDGILSLADVYERVNFTAEEEAASA